ncbi:MAG TPA: hypothetical protein VKY92_25120 [Verrucomicrobiae bacterium]|jgi:hypothetical protein|nr:hypothetical protein [Verrucomicrobiae bacterium]
MNKDQAAGATGGPLAEAEASLGQALAIIHRILPKLDEASRASEVGAALQRATGCLESARQAHRRLFAAESAQGASVPASLDSELVAVISAAVAAVLDRPYRLVSVQPVAAAVPHLNVWALEGRTQIFQSHKIR